MNEKLFDIDNFNIIQDNENYYFFRALNMGDNNDIEQKITTSENDRIERIRTDRERYEGQTKYDENSELSLEQMYDHIKMHYRKDTNCISLASNSNIAINYGRGSYKDKYVMIKVPKLEFGKQIVNAGQYMLMELAKKIEQTVDELDEEKKSKIKSAFSEIDNAKDKNDLKEIISKRYTAPAGEVDTKKAHLRKGIVYGNPHATISSYQALNDEQLLETNKVYARLAVLENENELKRVIPHSSNSKLRETIGSAFSSTEVIHYGEIKEHEIIEISKEVADLFALIQQVNEDNIDKNKIEKLKETVVAAIQNGIKIPELPEEIAKVRDNISIEEMYELTNGMVEYGKADSIVKNMYYLSKSRKSAIELSNILEKIVGENSEFDEVIEHIRNNGFRVEPEIISRKSGKGVKLSESVNLNLLSDEESLVNEIKAVEEADKVIQDLVKEKQNEKNEI